MALPAWASPVAKVRDSLILAIMYYCSAEGNWHGLLPVGAQERTGSGSGYCRMSARGVAGLVGFAKSHELKCSAARPSSRLLQQAGASLPCA